MIEKQCNILSNEILSQASAICFTSNGILHRDGRLIMGAGVAKAFRDKFGGLAILAGKAVHKSGNICQIIDTTSILVDDNGHYSKYHYTAIIAFPTKHHWKDPSDPELIKKSTIRLRYLADQQKWENIYLPRPGVGLGGLNWKDVRKVILPYLDNRFIITYL